MLHPIFLKLSILRQENEDLPIDKSKQNEDGWCSLQQIRGDAHGITQDKVWSDYP